MSRPASPDLVAVLDQARGQLAASVDALAALTADACARRFEVEAGALYVRARGGDGKSDRARRIDLARACAVSLLHTGAGWTQEAAASRFGMDRRNACKQMRRIEDMRDGDRDLDAWLESLERALGGQP